MSRQPISIGRERFSDDWAAAGDTRAIGYAFIDDVGHTAKDLASKVESTSDIDATLERANGFFAVVSRRDGEVHLVADRLSSYPLFYGTSGDRVYFGDDATWVREQVGDQSYDPVSELEYLLSGYVTGRDTLSPGVSQVRSGEHVVISGAEEVRRERWFEFPNTDETLPGSQKELLDRLDDVYLRAYNRLIEYADGRPIVVSLSAGHDSRLNLLMLERLGYDDVIALTYAEKDAETALCKHIVDDLGVPWIYAGETHDQWFDWYNSEEYEDFEAESGYLDRIPSFGCVMGVKKAREEGLVPDDAIFVTGDGVISTGEHIGPSFVDADTVSAEDVYEHIAASHYKFWEWGDGVEDLLHGRVESGLGDMRIATSADAVSAMERWDWQERQSKFIPRNYVFDFWGFDWWLPMWDAEVLDFWQRLPIDQKVDKRIHRTYVEELQESVTGVSEDRVQTSFWTGDSWGLKLKSALRNTRLDPVGSRFDKLARKVYFRYVDPLEYSDRSKFGIMTPEQYEELQTGILTIHGFQALEVLDRVSFDPPRNYDVPGSMEEVVAE